MAISGSMSDRLGELDTYLRDSDCEQYESFFARNGDGLAGWYVRSLGSVALLTIGEELVYAHTRFTGDETVKMFVVTSDRVVVATVDGYVDDTADHATQTVARAAIRRLGVRSSMRYDARGSQTTGWPGTLNLTVDYEGIDSAIELEANSYSRSSDDHIAPIWKLLDILRGDLAGGPSR